MEIVFILGGLYCYVVVLYVGELIFVDFDVGDDICGGEYFCIINFVEYGLIDGDILDVCEVGWLCVCEWCCFFVDDVYCVDIV